MGAAACAHLARRGADVIGLERFSIGHTFGSHSGQSRAYRLAYYEHPDYVPLLRRARELWMDINERTGREVFCPVGGVYLAPHGADFVRLAHEAAVTHGLEVELLDGAEARSRYPVFDVPDDWQALIEFPAGFIVPEWAVAAHAQLARAAGAQLREHVRVTGWDADGSGVCVSTDQGPVHGDRLVLCGGAWAGPLCAVPGMTIRPSRQVLGWLDAPMRAPVDRGQLPVWAMELADASVLYGFPRMEGLPGPSGFKVARHWAAHTTDPDDLDRGTCDADADDFLPHVAQYLPSAMGDVTAMESCLYGNSEDGHFRIGLHPDSERVVVAAGFSGHGFKFQPVIGEILADLAIDGGTAHPIEFLSLPQA
ncbi:MAG: N-methyl-L-tryptophan oxidase [Phycisphaerales bacterium]|nr:N-methyl-L-tryptophan oxidase [Phycisphaerales bacterium]